MKKKLKTRREELEWEIALLYLLSVCLPIASRSHQLEITVAATVWGFLPLCSFLCFFTLGLPRQPIL